MFCAWMRDRSASSDYEPFIQELQEILALDAPDMWHKSVSVSSILHSPSDSEDFEEAYVSRHNELLDNPEPE